MTNLVTPEGYEIQELATILKDKSIMDGILKGLSEQKDELFHSEILIIIFIMLSKSNEMIAQYILLDGNSHILLENSL
jgi:hypothetical protein